MIPADARDLVAALWMDLAGKDLHYDRTKFHNARQLRPGTELVRVSFPAFYTAVPYAPQALAQFIGRKSGGRTLYVFYAGRVMNAIAGVLLVMLAMRLLPEAAWVFGVVGLTPMFLYLAGSFSADAVTCGLAFCAAAAALRPINAAFPITAALLSLAKPGYALIALLATPRWRERKQRTWIGVGLIAVVVGGWIASASARGAYYPMRGDVVTDASAQMKHLAQAPFQFVRVALSDYASHATQYLDHLIGRLGWLDIGLPRIVLVLYVLLFLYAALSIPLRLGAVHRAMLAAVVAGTMLLLSLAQYLLWSPVGGAIIEGLQGRYFLPIAPLVLLAISANRLRWTHWAAYVVAIAGNAIALYTLTRHYYG
jgi:uncharacterized membrane protein